MRKLVASAQGGGGGSAFLLGALYRHGQGYPAQLVQRDPETTRIWLERCPLSLAALAELELGAGHAKPALQWARVWVILERELAQCLDQQAWRPAASPTRPPPIRRI